MSFLNHGEVTIKAIAETTKIKCSKCEQYKEAIVKYKEEKKGLLAEIDRLKKEKKLDYFTSHLLYGWEEYPLSTRLTSS